MFKAIDNFDPTQGVRFTTFAAPYIVGEIKHHFRDNKWSGHHH
ncbi:MAG: sigma factor [Acidobacteriota bacterium]